jgi:hypothetical protein
MGVGAPGPYSWLAIKSNGITSVISESKSGKRGKRGSLLMHYPCHDELVCVFLRVFRKKLLTFGDKLL